MADWDGWVQSMRVGIQAAFIAQECHAKMARGLGAPTVDDMRRFADEAAAIADLWQETLPK